MTADTLTRWNDWRGRTARAAILHNDWATEGDWQAVNDRYAETWWRALTGADRLAWYVADAYDRLLAVCVEAETARELAGHPILMRQAEKLQAQFARQTIPHGMIKAALANRIVERYKDDARQRAVAELDAAIREWGGQPPPLAKRPPGRLPGLPVLMS